MKKAEINQITVNTINSIRDLRDKVMSSNAEMQKKYVFEDSPYSSVINEYISNYREFYLYYTLNLQEVVVTRPALIKEIDFDLWISKEKCTNRDLMLKGKSPYAYDDENGLIDLHHIGQQYDAPFAELTFEEHLMYGNNHVFHSSENESWRSNKEKENAFKRERSEHWKKRAKGDYSTTPINDLKPIQIRDFQLPAEIQEEIKETVEVLFKECSANDLEYLSDLAKSYSIVKRTGSLNMSEFIFSTRNSSENIIKCSHCGSSEYLQFGYHKTMYENIQRYKCKKCGKTFTATSKSLVTNSYFSYMDWIKFIDCIYNGYSTEKTANTCGISTTAAHNNKIKLFYALKLLDDKVQLSGNIVVDETYLPLSFKGNRSNQEGFTMPRKSHKRGGENHTKGLSKNQVCIVCALDETGNSVAHISGTGAPRNQHIREVLHNHMDTQTTICLYTDESTALRKFAENEGYNHRCVISTLSKRKKKKLTKEEFISLKYIQKINSYHSRLKKFIDNFGGVSTKLLSGYLYLFTWKERNKDRDQIEAYKELMAVMTEPCLYASVNEIVNNNYIPDALSVDKTIISRNPEICKQYLDIYERYGNGESQAAIGRDLGMTRSNVNRIIKLVAASGQTQKTQREINNKEYALNEALWDTNRSKAILKLISSPKYVRENYVYNLFSTWQGEKEDLYDEIRKKYKLSDRQIVRDIRNVKYRKELQEAFSVYEEYKYKSLEEVYREIYADYLELKENFPDISNSANYKKLGEKYNFTEQNILRIINIMSNDTDNTYFTKKRKLTHKERFERDKAIFVDFINWEGTRWDFCHWAAKKYNLSYHHIQHILNDVLTADVSRYDII